VIDIFKDTEPMVYCADIEVDVLIPGKRKGFDKRTIKLKKHPITLLDGKVPSERLKQRLFRGIYNKYINRSEFDKIRFSIIKIENIKFLSKLCYKFNPVIH
jgi:hypothetical protein